MDPKIQSHYPSDLSESQRQLFDQYLPGPKSGAGRRGRPSLDRGRLYNAIMYVLKTGSQWRQLPREFGPWQTVYGHFNRWSKLEVWRGLVEELTQRYRLDSARHPEPSAGSIDSQSVKVERQGVDVGFDGGKQVKGRKRHVLTDTQGSVLCAVVTAANVGDREGLKELLSRWFLKGCRLRKIWVDSGYSGVPIKRWVEDLKKTHKIDLEVTGNSGKGFEVIPKRWVAERTFAWLMNFRRLSKDVEVLTQNSEAMIQLAMSSILVRRLA